MRTTAPILLTLATAALVGCQCRARDHDSAWDTAGGDRVRTLSATLRVTIETEADAPVELEGIMVADLPHSYRLQLWKLSQPVLDITRTRRGTFVLNRMDDGGIRDSRMSRPESFRAGIALIAGGMRMAFTARQEAAVGRPCPSARTKAGTVECCANPSPVDLVSCTLSGSKGRVLASADFGGFRRIGPAEWPTYIAVTNEWGGLRLAFDQIDLNEPLAPNAFQPPRLARKIR